MSADLDRDVGRLFVPLKTIHYRRFEAGEKDVELRGWNDQFNPETVVEGRRVELRRGYSTDDSLFGTVAHVWTSDDLARLLDAANHARIHPGATFDDALEAARELLDGYDRYIAFAVDLGLDVEVLEDDADTDACICGHTRADHRYRRGNQHTTWTALDDCRADGCDCPGFGRWVENVDDDRGAVDGADDGEADEKVECTVCGALVGRGPAGLGIKQHASKHRREFADRYGRGPHDYAEVRDRLGRPAFRVLDDDSQMTLYESTDTRARDARNDDQQADLVNPDQLNPVDDETDEDGGSP